MTLRAAIPALGVLALAGAASAQNFSSFSQVDALHDITVNQLGPLQFQLVIGPSPTLRHNGIFYPLNSVFGFWALSEDDDITGSTTGFGVWASNGSSSGTGAILGWRANPNQGLGPGSSQTFTFNPGTDLSSVEFWGFHIRLSNALFPGTTGNTGHAYVPGAGSLAVLGFAGLAAARRRR